MVTQHNLNTTQRNHCNLKNTQYNLKTTQRNHENIKNTQRNLETTISKGRSLFIGGGCEQVLFVFKTSNFTCILLGTNMEGHEIL